MDNIYLNPEHELLREQVASPLHVCTAPGVERWLGEVGDGLSREETSKRLRHLLSGEPVPAKLRPLARRAVNDCPALALMLVQDS